MSILLHKTVIMIRLKFKFRSFSSSNALRFTVVFPNRFLTVFSVTEMKSMCHDGETTKNPTVLNQRSDDEKCSKVSVPPVRVIAVVLVSMRY